MADNRASSKKISARKSVEISEKESDQLRENRLYRDTPHINVNILGEEYPCLIDSGSTSTVMSESLYNVLRGKKPGILTLPVRGMLCSGALGKATQRVKFQCQIPVKIGENMIHVMFLIIPNLTSDLIIGTDLLQECRSIINLDRLFMSLKKNKQPVGEVPFLKEGECIDTEAGATHNADITREVFFCRSTHSNSG